VKQTIKFTIFIYTLLYSTLVVLFFFDIIDYLFIYSSIIAGVLNLINTTIAIILFEYSHSRGNKIFLLANVGGIGLRMMLMLVSIIFIVKFLKIHEIGFLLIFFCIYFILLSSEVLYFHKKMKKQNI